MRPGEIGLGDPGYGGHSLKIYAPPKKNERLYVDELDKVELTLQRRVEMANRIIKRFACLGSVYRKGAVHAYSELELLCSLIPKMVFWDLLLNQDHSGEIHVDGPTADPVPVMPSRRVKVGGLPRRQQLRLRRCAGKAPVRLKTSRRPVAMNLPGRVRVIQRR